AMAQILGELVASVRVEQLRTRASQVPDRIGTGRAGEPSEDDEKSTHQATADAPSGVRHRARSVTKPRYLVHPVSGDPMLFDVRCEAECPTCGARYRRTLNVIALVG